MQLGTAKITQGQILQGHFQGNPVTQQYFEVRWMNVGSFLRNEPRRFLNRDDAQTFCREHGLRIVS